MKRVVLSLLAAILALSLVSAVDISLSKSSYYPGETLQAEITGSFIDNLLSANIAIYSSDGVHETPVAGSGLIKSGARYYYYAVLPIAAGDYQLKIDGPRYYDSNTQQSSEPITKNFTIASTNESYISFNPGQMAVTKDFSLTVKAYNSIQQIDATFEATGQKESFELPVGSSKILYFSIAGINNSVSSKISINSYSIPVFVTPINPIINNTENINDSKSSPNIPLKDIIELSPKTLNATLLPGADYYFRIHIYNTLTVPIRDINLSSDFAGVSLNPDYIDELDEEKIVNITINVKDSFDGFVNFTYKNGSLALPLYILVTSSAINVSSNIAPINQAKTCSDLRGVKCDAEKNEECSGTQTYASDGICCMSTCSIIQGSDSWIWGLILLILLGVGGWYLYKKQKQAPKGEDEEAALKRNAEKYKERMLLKDDTTEVRKGLTKN